MSSRAAWIVLCCLVGILAGLPAVAQTDSGVIRLRPSGNEQATDAAAPEGEISIVARRGFDYQAFEAKLQALWFQRKAFLADGRDSDAARQSEQIRAFCKEEGVRRLDFLSAALIVEARDAMAEGNYRRALDSLNLAANFSPGNPQLHLARAQALWKSGQGYLSAGGELLRAARGAAGLAVGDLHAVSQFFLALVASLLATLVVFSVFMIVRYNVPFRHEVAEWLGQFAEDRWVTAAGWALLFLPLMVWFGAGWIAVYWIVITFRFMRPTERLTAVALLLGCALAAPAYRVAVTVYGTSADPMVRTTLAAADGKYSPERVLKLRRLVDSYPEDPVYRFLLGGLYKNGRYFDEAFAEYKESLKLDPGIEQAHINIGNIFYATGQYGEATASYRRALDLDPDSLDSYFNMHLAQSEAFKFKEAEESLRQARRIDARLVAEMLSRSAGTDERPAVVDASLNRFSVVGAALEGRTPRETLAEQRPAGATIWLRSLANPVSGIALLSILASGAMLAMTRAHAPARRCIRCGGAFCRACKSSRDGHEYCSQCLHLYVLGDGLAPDAKNHKLYEVECYERATRRRRSLLSLVLPGSGQLLRGRPGRGALIVTVWFAAWIAFRPEVLRPIEFWIGRDLRFDVLRSIEVPQAYGIDALAFAAALLVATTWIAGNLWRFRRQEA